MSRRLFPDGDLSPLTNFIDLFDRVRILGLNRELEGTVSSPPFVVFNQART
jgi:hypothetical protein